jgi:hypothetical protein
MYFSITDVASSLCATIPCGYGYTTRGVYPFAPPVVHQKIHVMTTEEGLYEMFAARPRSKINNVEQIIRCCILSNAILKRM